MAVIMSKQFSVPKKSIQASDLAVGSSVFLNVGGASKEFLVVHQGLPDTSIYDSSCNGTWLLMKDVYKTSQWYSSNDRTSYEYSTVHSYLNNTFYNLLDEDIRALIVNATLPYVVIYSSDGTVCSKKNTVSGKTGMSAKVFAPSVCEVDPNKQTGTSYVYGQEGSCLSYFSDGTAANRIAYKDGIATEWWLRSPSRYYTTGAAWSVYTQGSTTESSYDTATCGIRPALILPSNVKFNSDTREFMGVM